jgi:1,4-dihydroxy-2-naphthoate octaprenyltransferase
MINRPEKKPVLFIMIILSMITFALTSGVLAGLLTGNVWIGLGGFVVGMIITGGVVCACERKNLKENPNDP